MRKKAKWEWERTLAVGNKVLSWNRVSAQQWIQNISYAYQRTRQRSCNPH